MNNNINIFGVKNKNNRRSINLLANAELKKYKLNLRNVPSKMNSGYNNRNNASCGPIPHMETIPRNGRQVAIGRQANLAKYGYYKCNKFIACDIRGNKGMNWSLALNDVLIYYAATVVRSNFPIRLVDYPTNNNKTRISGGTVANREQRQILKFFGMYKYKSLTSPGVYFFSHKSNLAYPGIVRP
jgi:hypothetical protein